MPGMGTRALPPPVPAPSPPGWYPDPWQVAQFAWKSFLPSSTVSADFTCVSPVAAIAAEAPA